MVDAGYARFRQNPDGRTLLLFSADPVRKVSFLDLERGEITCSVSLTRGGGGSVRYPGIFPFSASPDGSVLATAENETVTLRSLRDGTEAESFALPETVKELAFSPDGCVLLAAVREEAFTWAIQWELE
ncbi:MAG: hypothetical protein J6U01_02645 [Clostridia bacterium]|nr:hypothetical protein [Clostridia bacterium]